MNLDLEVASGVALYSERLRILWILGRQSFTVSIYFPSDLTQVVAKFAANAVELRPLVSELLADLQLNSKFETMVWFGSSVLSKFPQAFVSLLKRFVFGNLMLP